MKNLGIPAVLGAALLVSCSESGISLPADAPRGGSGGGTSLVLRAAVSSPSGAVYHDGSSSQNPFHSLSFSFTDSGSGDRTYECRVTLKSNPEAVGYDPCTSGEVITINPSLSSGGGTFLFQARALEGGAVVEQNSLEHYVHPSLDGVEKVSALPHSDDWYFQEAGPFLSQTRTFTGETSLQAPFVKLKTSEGTEINVLTLRKKFVMNESKTLLLLKRVYQSPKLQSTISARRRHGYFTRVVSPQSPRDGNHSQRFGNVSCQVLVINADDNAVCFTPIKRDALSPGVLTWVPVDSPFLHLRLSSRSDVYGSERSLRWSSTFSRKYRKSTLTDPAHPPAERNAGTVLSLLLEE